MLNFAAVRRIFVARQHQDMRRGINLLSSVVEHDLGQDPYTGDCFIFFSRDRKKLKAVVWEDGGFWLCRGHADIVSASQGGKIRPPDGYVALGVLDAVGTDQHQRQLDLVCEGAGPGLVGDRAHALGAGRPGQDSIHRAQQAQIPQPQALAFQVTALVQQAGESSQ